jgi:hypothetical protein
MAAKIKRKTKVHTAPPRPAYGPNFINNNEQVARNFFVSLIVVCSVIFVAVVFTQNGLVGLATYQGSPAVPSLTYTNGQVTLSVNVGTNRVSTVYFEMAADNLCTLLDVADVQNRLWQNQFAEITCDDKLIFTAADLADYKTGNFEIVSFPFSQATTFVVNPFNVYEITGPFNIMSGSYSQEITITETTNTTDSPGRRSGFSCSQDWQCGSTWSYCNSTLQQSALCADKNRCDQNELTKRLVRSCDSCDESWVCSVWSSCSGGRQTRTCSDEHSCGKTVYKPQLEKGCTVPASGPPPARIIQQPPAYAPPVQQPASFWDTWGTWVLGLAVGLLVIIIIVVLLIFTRHKKVVYNYDELIEWIKKERAMGTSNRDIRNILVDKTGWKDDEVKTAFEKVKD